MQTNMNTVVRIHGIKSKTQDGPNKSQKWFNNQDQAEFEGGTILPRLLCFSGAEFNAGHHLLPPGATG